MKESLPAESPLTLKRADIVCLAALFVLAVVILFPILFMPADRAPGLPGHDGETQWLPWRVYAAESVKSGTLPLWNPHILCGTPFVGNFQSALFYPPNLIYLVCPVGVAARLSILFHLWLSLLFAYLLGRAFGCDWPGCAVVAMTFAFCAPQLLRVPAGHWGVACAIPWTALVFLCAELVLRKPRLKPMLFGSAGVAMQVLSGVPQYVFITAVAVGCYAVLRSIRDGHTWPERGRRWAAIGGLFLFGALLSSIQLLPGIEAARHGARSLPMRREWIELFSWGPENALTFLLPGFYGGAGGAPYWGRFLFWEMNGYVGIVSLVLALMALASAKSRVTVLRLVGLALAMMLLALGKHTPLQGLLLTVVPMSGMFRGSAKFLLPAALAVSVMAGLGAQRLLSDGATAWGKARWLLAGIAATLVILILLGLSNAGFLQAIQRSIVASGEILGPVGAVNVADFFRQVEVLDGLAALVLLAAAALALLFWKTRTNQIPASAIGAFLAVLVGLDFAHFSVLFVNRNATFNATSAPLKSAASFVREKGPDYRMLALGWPRLNDSMMEKTFSIEGIEPNPPARFHQLFMAAHGLPADVAPSIYRLRGMNQAARLGALKWILAPDDVRLDLAESRLASREDDWNIYELNRPIPRSLVVYDAVVAQTANDTLTCALALAPAASLVLEESPPFPPDAPSPPPLKTQSRIVETSPNTVVVEASLERDGWLVLHDNWYPGWEAWVEDENGVTRVPVLRANYAFRAVRLTAGNHRVHFRYPPLSFRIGLWLSVITWIAWMAVIIRRRFWRGTKEET